ncbi:hypothetical protein KC19_N013000 [Ceratodon purpureus]|nr:hypothetical protein KC19_N013000 [Ceratodon purpureus]
MDSLHVHVHDQGNSVAGSHNHITYNHSSCAVLRNPSHMLLILHNSCDNPHLRSVSFKGQPGCTLEQALVWV